MAKFTTQEDAFLKKNYLLIPTKRMSKMLGRSESSARQRLHLLGLVVPEEIAAKFKKQNQFQKGKVPVNKGKKMVEYMSAEKIEKSAKTRFRKGQLPKNTKADFVVTIRTDKRGVKYKFIRISKAVWIPLHRYNWIKQFGKIPPKMKLIFKDKDTMNCEVQNLELVSPVELMKKNSLHNYPAEIKQIIQLGGVLKRKINKKTKQINDEE